MIVLLILPRRPLFDTKFTFPGSYLDTKPLFRHTNHQWTAGAFSYTAKGGILHGVSPSRGSPLTGREKNSVGVRNPIPPSPCSTLFSGLAARLLRTHLGAASIDSSCD